MENLQPSSLHVLAKSFLTYVYFCELQLFLVFSAPPMIEDRANGETFSLEKEQSGDQNLPHDAGFTRLTCYRFRISI